MDLFHFINEHWLLALSGLAIAASFIVISDKIADNNKEN